MLEFKQTDTAAVLILTLSEFVTIPSPYYLFVFTHVVTKDVIAFVKGTADDQSAFQFRYNQFTINIASLFAGKNTGEWHYRVYQQASSSNTDPALADALLEQGKAYLDRDPAFAFTQYDSPTSFKAYNG